ncbi:MAG: DUF4180 domain-containing protein [Candidatus Kapabacteria bacterium]|nr:DUF4180 domain-containing protein [Candidatus Kapabacteria bacterium]MBX7155451.1 DUF4180 domain-containing protein [Bacteroidota bacterium]
MEVIVKESTNIAEIQHNAVVLSTAQDAVEILANVLYQGVDKLILHEENITPEFFDLRTGIAGEILQKFSNYQGYLAIVGDFSKYTSKSLQDFIRESNKQGRIVFVSTVDEAVAALSK